LALNITLFAGPSSSGKTTHINILQSDLAQAGFAWGRMSSTYRFSSRILVGGECPAETETTLSITVHRLTYRVQGLSSTFISTEYDGQSHMGAALALHHLARALEGLGPAEARRAGSSLGVVAGALLGAAEADSVEFVAALKHLLSLRLPGGSTLGEAYFSGLARAMGLESPDRLKRVAGEFMSGLARARAARVDAGVVSVLANYTAARVVEEELGEPIAVVVPIAPPSGLPCRAVVSGASEVRLSELLYRHLSSGASGDHVVIVKPGEAGKFYAEFLMTRLAITGLLVGFLLAGFHAVEGGKTLNIMHPADMIEYSLLYAARQAQIDALTGSLLDTDAAKALEELAEALEEALSGLQRGDADALDRALEKADELGATAIEIVPRGRGLLAYPVNMATVLQDTGISQALTSIIAGHLASPGLEGLELARRLGGTVGRVAEAAVKLARAASAAPGHVAEKVENLVSRVAGLVPVASLLLSAWQATLYTHVLLVKYLFSFASRAAESGLLDPETLKLTATLSYLDRYEDPKAAFARLRSCVYSPDPRACEGLRTYPLTVGLDHETAESIASSRVYGRGSYVLPGGYRAEEGYSNKAFTLAMLCHAILPPIYGEDSVERLPTCRKALEATRPAPAG